MLFTILAGVSIFVLGQFFLKLVLEPIVDFKRSLGELSAFFLREQSKITNAHCTVEIENELKRLSSTLLANKQAVPFYNFFSMLRCLPLPENLNSACGSLNLISYYISPNNPGDEVNVCSEIHSEMSNVATKINVQIRYSSL
jgi:hypothetical protein